MNELLQVILLGIVEGLTEFIPVSSTGHLIIVGELIDLVIPNKESFNIFIQLGAILSVLILYRNTFIDLLKGWKKQSWQTTRFSFLHIIVTCLPVMILGYLFHGFIKAQFFNVYTVATALILGGVVLILVERKSASNTVVTLECVSLRQSLIIGLLQCLALCPGVSRSGATIIGGLVAGLHRKAAAEFSFVVAVPVMIVAVLYDFFKILPQISSGEVGLFALGFIVSFVVALASIKLLLAVLQRYSMAVFGYYRILLGLLVFWWFS